MSWTATFCANVWEKWFSRTLSIKSQHIAFYQWSFFICLSYTSHFSMPSQCQAHTARLNRLLLPPAGRALLSFLHHKTSLDLLLTGHLKRGSPFARWSESDYLAGKGQPEFVYSKWSWLEKGPEKCQYKPTCKGRYTSFVNRREFLDWYCITSSDNKQNDCWTLRANYHVASYK